MSQPKPILLLFLPYNVDGFRAYEGLEAIRRYLENKYGEWYITDVIPISIDEEISFQVFYEKDHKPVTIEELKQIIKDASQGV